MQLTLTDEETQVVADAVKSRIDALLMSIGKADTRSFKDRLIEEGALLEAVYERLGCVHEEWSEAKGCDFRSSK
ncbi:MAG: hypothetical protein JXA87_02700 [Thermoleophilia bacterium]|nr:hypothetical protein [Thermoleophilia bacterium]